MCSTHDIAQARSPDGPVDGDVACAHCGYNLRGLTKDGKCPECFESVADSLRGDLLKYADAVWLERLRFGAALKLWNIGAGILLGVVSMVFLGPVPLILTEWLAAIAPAFGVWASFVITSQEPRISLEENPLTWRKTIRACAVAGLIGNLLPRLAGGTAFGQVLIVPATVLSLAVVISLFGELLYFRRFALRIPDLRLARSTRIVQWAATASMAGLFVLPVIMGALIFPPGAAGAAPGVAKPSVWLIGMCAALPAGLVFYIWYVVLLFRYRRVFATAAQASRDRQASSSGLGNVPESNGDEAEGGTSTA